MIQPYWILTSLNRDEQFRHLYPLLDLQMVAVFLCTLPYGTYSHFLGRWLLNDYQCAILKM